MKSILCSPDFDIDTDFQLINKSKDAAHNLFSTPYTLVDLEYDLFDVVEKLKELSINEYSETLLDKNNSSPPLLYVFGKNINNQQVYIKLKIKNTNHKKILCVSFHYAEYKMNFPYS